MEAVFGTAESEIRAVRWYALSSTEDVSGIKRGYSDGMLKVTTLEQVLFGLDSMSKAAVLTVRIPDEATIEFDEMAHRDGCSDFSLYEGYEVSDVVLDKAYRLENVTEMEELVKEGLFESKLDFFHGSNRERYANWLCERATCLWDCDEHATDVYRHFADHFGKVLSDTLKKAAYCNSLGFFNFLVEHHNLSKYELSEAIPVLAGRGELDLLKRLHKEERFNLDDEFSPLDSALDSAVIAGHGEIVKWLMGLGAVNRELDARFMANFFTSGDRVLTEELVAKFASSYKVVPAEAIRSLWPHLFVAASRYRMTPISEILLADVGSLDMKHSAIPIALSTGDHSALDALMATEDEFISASQQQTNALLGLNPREMEEGEQNDLLEKCCANGQYYAVRWLLDNLGYSESIINDRLLQCSRLGLTGLVKLLHDHGADAGYCEHAAMRYAKKENYTDLRDYLFGLGEPEL